MEPVWQRREDAVKDKHGENHRVSFSSYNNLDAKPDSEPPPGPWGAFGLRAEIEHQTGKIDVWLLCSELQWGYLVGETEEPGQTLLEAKTLESRRNQVLEDFTIKVKLAFRTGQFLPGDELQVRLGPDLRVPPYGPEWRRALRAD